MRKIVYTRPDGGVSVVTPVINTYPAVEQITESGAEQRAWDKLPADAINPQWVDAVPVDRTFRNAWKAGAGCVEHDMVKCRDLHRERLRELRKPKLAAADVEFMRALESGKPTTEIIARKQALRDVTADPAIEAAQTPEELKVVIPKCLVEVMA
jgi:hypothetical protein